MRRTYLSIALAVGIFTLAACSDSGNVTSVPTTQAAPMETVPTSPIGGTLKIWDGPSSFAEYTVANPRIENGRYTIGILIADKQGDAYDPGGFDVLTSSGKKIKQYGKYDTPLPGQIELLSRLMVAGEVRYGFVQFDVPPGDTVQKIFLYRPLPLAAVWTATT